MNVEALSESGTWASDIATERALEAWNPGARLRNLYCLHSAPLVLLLKVRVALEHARSTALVL